MNEIIEKEVIRRIKAYSYEAAEFCECKKPGDEQKCDILLAKAEALQDFMRWVKTQQ